MDENAKTKKKSVEEMVKDLDTKIEREEDFLQKAEKNLVETKEKIKEAESRDRRLEEKEIAKSYIAQVYPAQEFLSTKVELSAGGEMFTASGKVILQQGWKSLYQNDAKDDEEEQQSLPDMQQGDSVEFAGGKIVEGVTKPPARFTPATLLRKH